MATTVWTQRRLERVYAYYNRRFWSGKLPTFTVILGLPPNEKNLLGFCDWNTQRVYINVAAHETDRSVRDTLLHEMAHVGTSAVRVAHGYKFLAQMEHLLRSGAPVSFGNPEMPNVEFLAMAVPRRFPLCRAAARRLQRRNERAIRKNLPVQRINDEQILLTFEDAAIEGLSWNTAKGDPFPQDYRNRRRTRVASVFIATGISLRYSTVFRKGGGDKLGRLGGRYGLLDVEGHPVNEWARRLLVRARARFKKAQLDYF